MSMVDQTITVDAVARDYVNSWDSDYADELAKGSCKIGKVAITDGESIIRVAHSTDKKGIERHIFSMRDTITPSGEDEYSVQAHLVLSFPENNSDARDLSELIAAGLRSALAVAGFETSLAQGEL